MIILGLDISLKRTGYFIFETSNMRIMDYGAILTDDTELESHRLLKIHNKIEQLLKQYHPQGCGIEKEFASNNPDTLMKLSHCHGVCLSLLAQFNIPYTYYPVMTLKSETLDGMTLKKDDGTRKKSEELKEEVKNKIISIFGEKQFFKPYGLDETDAASAAYVYHKVRGIDIVKAKKEAARKVKVRKKKTMTKTQAKNAVNKLKQKISD